MHNSCSTEQEYTFFNTASAVMCQVLVTVWDFGRNWKEVYPEVRNTIFSLKLRSCIVHRCSAHHRLNSVSLQKHSSGNVRNAQISLNHCHHDHEAPKKRSLLARLCSHSTSCAKMTSTPCCSNSRMRSIVCSASFLSPWMQQM